MPAEFTLPTAFKRTPYDETVTFVGVDWTGETLALEVRQREGDQGTAVIALTNAASGQGLSVTTNPAFLIPGTTITAIATILRIRIDETTLEAIPYNTPANTSAELRFDLHVGAGVSKRVEAVGGFVIRPGVTL